MDLSVGRVEPRAGLSLDLGGTRAAVVRALKAAAPATGGALLLLLAWWAVAIGRKDIPAPLPTIGVFWSLVANPFYYHGPNDQGIGLQLGGSLGRVFAGFGLGALVAIPIGMAMGASRLMRGLFYPIVQ